MDSASLRETAIGWVFVLTLLAQSIFADDATQTRPGAQVLEEFDIAKSGDVVVLPVTIGGKQYPFLLSVAARKTTIDFRLRDILGRSAGASDDASKSVDIEELPGIPMKIGSQSFTPATPVRCEDLGDICDYYGHEAFGVVGLDFLEGRTVQIDFDHGKFRVLSAPPRDLRERSVFEPLLKVEGSYVIELEILGSIAPLDCKIDTLFEHSLMLKSLWLPVLSSGDAFVGLHDGYAVVSGAVRPAGRAGIVKSVSFHGRTHTDVSVTEKCDDRVGRAFLSRYLLTLNFGKFKYAYFTPGARVNDAELYDWSGLEVIRRQGKLTVMHVAANSVAAKAGIQNGDIVVELDGATPEKWSLFEIRQRFKEQSSVQLKIHRRNTDAALVIEATLKSLGPTPLVSRPAARTE